MVSEKAKSAIDTLSESEIRHEIEKGRTSRFQRDNYAYLKVRLAEIESKKDKIIETDKDNSDQVIVKQPFFKRKWTDGEKWIMGIISVLITTSLIAAFSFYFSNNDRKENRKVDSKIIDVITARISTGASNDAGTNARVFLKLCGREFQLDSPERHNDFEANETRDYAIPVQQFGFSVEDLKRNPIVLRHDNSGSGGPSWQVRNVTILFKPVGDSSSYTLFSDGVGWLKSEPGYSLFKEWPQISK